MAQAYDSISKEDFLNQAKASNYVDDYSFLKGAANDSLEGFLFPKTYSLGDSPTADDLIRAMLDQFKTEYKSLDFASCEAKIKERYGVEMSDYDIVNLASIVEREGLNADQRAHVASVFYNRLAGKLDGLRYLNSDATMMYVTGGEVTADDLQSDSPYNTYKHEGLPPTPICSPSLEALKATLEPTTDDLYSSIRRTRSTSQTYKSINSLGISMTIFAPNDTLPSVDRIDLDTLWADGKRAILLDRDNTLVPRDTEQVPAAVSAWLDTARAKGFKLCMVSNNWHRDQVMSSARELGLEAISHAMKPAPFALKAGLKRLAPRQTRRC